MLMKGANAGTNSLVGGRNPLARAEEVKPRLHDEGLVQMLRVDRVAIDAPAHRPIAQTHATQLVDRVGKLGVVLRRDAVLNGDANRTVSRFRIERELRRRILELMRRVVGKRPMQDAESPDERDR